MDRIKISVGTLFGTGLLPHAPGTWASLLTLAFVYGVWVFSPGYGILILAIAAILLSLWSASASVAHFGEDPPQFVMDECAGQSVVFLLTSFYYPHSQSAAVLLTGFVLFRFFDILKPFGVNRLQKLPGKFGILCDDLLAGFYALVCLELIKMAFAAAY